MQESQNLPPSDEPTEVLFVNHASILIKQGGRYLLTDPWHQKPAFGSWLPTLPQYVHPAYLASLGGNLTILISHGHDDHCDDELLRIFDKDTEMVTASYASPSVKNRLRKLGFQSITAVDSGGSKISNGFSVRSFINPLRSLDDATYTVNTGNALVIHCNDNWFEFDKATLQAISVERRMFAPQNIAFLSQTNSASGYPLNYRIFTDAQKLEILAAKVASMIRQGLRNADSLGLTSFCSYAGYASVFVKDRPEYLNLGILPTAKFIVERLLTDASSKSLLQKVKILDFYPGDVLDLSEGRLRKAFVSSGSYSDDAIKMITQSYYRNYRVIENCDTYRTQTTPPFDAAKLDYFLDNLNRFAVRKIDADGAAFASVLGKSFEILIEDLGISRRMTFGVGLVDSEPDGRLPNKRMIAGHDLMTQVLDGQILFENLYTGYEAEWERHPVETYNRDIVMFIVMYSYVYKNTLCKQYGGASN